MADGVFNIAKGRVHGLVEDGAKDLIIVLLEAADADATLVDFDDLAALIAGANNTESAATNYARLTVTNANVTITVDDTNNRVDIDIPDQTFTGLGPGNDIVKLLICADGASDAARIPLLHFDFPESPTGSDVVAQVNASGIYRAA